MSKWVVHVIGPDDVYPFPDELTALRDANATNKMMASIERRPNDPFVIAVVKNIEIEEL